ncbi:MAG: DNA/RNA non-specific endonuclease [Halopseudomonas sp.]
MERVTKASAFSIYLLLLASNTHASSCGEHLKYGLPSEADIILCRDGYSVGFDLEKHAPLWTSYFITKASAEASCDQDPDFIPDPDLPESEQASDEDYAGSGWDKGHMAPRATMDFSCESEKQSIYYTNAAPQHPKINRNGWRTLESRIRNLTDSAGGLYIVTGAHYGNNKKLRGHVGIPTHFYKILYSPEAHAALAFWYPNGPMNAKDIPSGLTSINEIESKTGYDFLNLLSAFEEVSVEATIGSSLFNDLQQ